MNGLMLHCGAHHVTKQEVIDSRAGEPISDTYYPIEHGDFLDHVTRVLTDHGYEIKNEAHALMRKGQRYFGLLEVHHPDMMRSDERSPTVGVRNGHDGQMPASIAGGDYTFVCDNLCFSGDVFKIQRKHTRFIHRDIHNVISVGVAKLNEVFATQEERMDFYKETPIKDRVTFNDLLITAMEHRAALANQLPKVVKEWNRSVNGEGPGGHESLAGNSYYSLLNCFTEVEKLSPSPQQSPIRNRLLTRLLDQASGFTRHQQLQSTATSAVG